MLSSLIKSHSENADLLFQDPATPHPLRPEDRTAILGLERRSPFVHIQLDWRTVESWLSHPDFRVWVLHEAGTVRSALGAATQRHANGGGDTAWLRLIVAVPHVSNVARLLDPLWPHLRDELKQRGIKEVGILLLHPWPEPMIERWGFKRLHAVVTLRRVGWQAPEISPPQGVTIRPVRAEDMPRIAALDGRAFLPLWHYPQATLEAASTQAAQFMIAERDGQMLGYQLSTIYQNSGHLARLATDPAAQGQGIGALMVRDMIQRFARQAVHRVTVNTQSDNLVSQRLYQRMGFSPMDEGAPVWAIRLD